MKHDAVRPNRRPKPEPPKPAPAPPRPRRPALRGRTAAPTTTSTSGRQALQTRMLPREEAGAMMRRGRTTAAVAVMAVLGGVTTLLSRSRPRSRADDPECLTAYEDSVPLQEEPSTEGGTGEAHGLLRGVLPHGGSRGMSGRVPESTRRCRRSSSKRRMLSGRLLRGQGEDGRRASWPSGFRDGAAIDPGEHTFSFEVAGRPSIEKHL